MQDRTDFPLLVDKMQACQLVGVSPTRFDAMRKNGILHGIKQDGRRFYRDEIRQRINRAAGISEQDSEQAKWDNIVLERLNASSQNPLSH